jgi:Alcohol dehydrogenase GroES-like domain
MKAIVQERFGPPEALRLVDIDKPEVGADDVLVRVHAAALNPADWHILRGDPLVARLMGVGLTKPKATVAGIDAAGVVEAVGANVRDLRLGDEVRFHRHSDALEALSARGPYRLPQPGNRLDRWRPGSLLSLHCHLHVRLLGRGTRCRPERDRRRHVRRYVDAFCVHRHSRFQRSDHVDRLRCRGMLRRLVLRAGQRDAVGRRRWFGRGSDQVHDRRNRPQPR